MVPVDMINSPLDLSFSGSWAYDILRER
jgi:hypothetical protein